MDAGFWTAMRIRGKWLRDIASMVFTAYYLIAAEQADEKVRKVRALVTVEHLRVSWNKGLTPYLSFLQNLMRPRFMKYPPRAIRIPRPANSDYKEPVNGWLFFNGPLSELKKHNNIVIDVPGGGFVAMNPRTNDDKLFAWAGRTGLPVLSLDYGKAPEFPYPYALNECFDVYQMIIASRGRCVGLSGDAVPKIVITGDSAGGNIAASLTLMIVEAGSTETRQYLGQSPLPIPEGLILLYPGLDMNIGNWMSDEQMSLIKDRRTHKTNKNIISRKSMHYTLAAGTPHQSDDEGEISPPKTLSQVPESPPMNLTSSTAPQYSSAAPPLQSPSIDRHHARRTSASHRPEPLRTRLAMSSMLSYFGDRILTPEMMRAMIILYIGPHNRPDFSLDYLLSPILAPDSLLADFPKTYFLTGERDPLVDDTVIFAGRLRRAKMAKHAAEQASNLHSRLGREFDDRDVVEVVLIPGISHGFLQLAGIFPEGWTLIHRCGRWIEDIFAESDLREGYAAPNTPGFGLAERARRESSGEEDGGLEISMTRKGKEGGGAGEESNSKLPKPRKDVLQQRKQKENLVREEMNSRRKKRQGMGDRKKSMVSLASEDDLLGRRMLGIAGPLTGIGGDD
jgi:acetyl esterase/lipase